MKITEERNEERYENKGMVNGWTNMQLLQTLQTVLLFRRYFLQTSLCRALRFSAHKEQGADGYMQVF